MEESVNSVVRSRFSYGSSGVPTSCYGYTNFGHDFADDDDDDDDDGDGQPTSLQHHGGLPLQAPSSTYTDGQPEVIENGDDGDDDDDDDEDEYGDGVYSDFSVEELHEFMLQQQQQSLLEYACSARRYSLLETIEEETVDEVFKSGTASATSSVDGSSEYSGVWCWGDDFTDGAESVIYVDNPDVDVEQEDREVDEFEELIAGTSSCCWTVAPSGACTANAGSMDVSGIRLNTDGYLLDAGPWLKFSASPSSVSPIGVDVIEPDKCCPSSKMDTTTTTTWSAGCQNNVIQDPSDREGSWLDSSPPEYDRERQTSDSEELLRRLQLDHVDSSDSRPAEINHHRETMAGLSLPPPPSSSSSSSTSAMFVLQSHHATTAPEVLAKPIIDGDETMEVDSHIGLAEDQHQHSPIIIKDHHPHHLESTPGAVDFRAALTGSDRDLLIVFDTEEAEDDDDVEQSPSNSTSEYGSWSDAIDAYLMSLATAGHQGVVDKETQKHQDQARLTQIKDYLTMLEEATAASSPTNNNRRSTGVGSDVTETCTTTVKTTTESRSRRPILGVDLHLGQLSAALLPVVESPTSLVNARDVHSEDFDADIDAETSMMSLTMEERTDGDGAAEDIPILSPTCLERRLSDDNRSRSKETAKVKRLHGTKSAPDLSDIQALLMDRGRRGRCDDLDMFNSHHPFVAYSTTNDEDDYYASRSQSEPSIVHLTKSSIKDQVDTSLSKSVGKSAREENESFNFVFGGDLLNAVAADDNRRKSFDEYHGQQQQQRRRRSMYSFSSKSLDSQFETSSEDESHDNSTTSSSSSNSSSSEDVQDEGNENGTGSVTMRKRVTMSSLFPRFTPPGTLRSFRSFDSLNLAGRDDDDDAEYNDVTTSIMVTSATAIQNCCSSEEQGEEEEDVKESSMTSETQRIKNAAAKSSSSSSMDNGHHGRSPWLRSMDGIEEEESSDPEVEVKKILLRPSSEDLSEDSGCCDINNVYNVYRIKNNNNSTRELNLQANNALQIETNNYSMSECLEVEAKSVVNESDVTCELLQTNVHVESNDYRLEAQSDVEYRKCDDEDDEAMSTPPTTIRPTLCARRKSAENKDGQFSGSQVLEKAEVVAATEDAELPIIASVVRTVPPKNKQQATEHDHDHHHHHHEVIKTETGASRNNGEQSSPSTPPPVELDLLTNNKGRRSLDDDDDDVDKSKPKSSVAVDEAEEATQKTISRQTWAVEEVDDDVDDRQVFSETSSTADVISVRNVLELEVIEISRRRSGVAEKGSIYTKSSEILLEDLNTKNEWDPYGVRPKEQHQQQQRQQLEVLKTDIPSDVYKPPLLNSSNSKSKRSRNIQLPVRQEAPDVGLNEMDIQPSVSSSSFELIDSVSTKISIKNSQFPVCQAAAPEVEVGRLSPPHVSASKMADKDECENVEVEWKSQAFRNSLILRESLHEPKHRRNPEPEVYVDANESNRKLKTASRIPISLGKVRPAVPVGLSAQVQERLDDVEKQCKLGLPIGSVPNPTLTQHENEQYDSRRPIRSLGFVQALNSGIGLSDDDDADKLLVSGSSRLPADELELESESESIQGRRSSDWPKDSVELFGRRLENVKFKAAEQVHVHSCPPPILANSTTSTTWTTPTQSSNTCANKAPSNLGESSFAIVPSELVASESSSSFLTRPPPPPSSFDPGSSSGGEENPGINDTLNKVFQLGDDVAKKVQCEESLNRLDLLEFDDAAEKRSTTSRTATQPALNDTCDDDDVAVAVVTDAENLTQGEQIVSLERLQNNNNSQLCLINSARICWPRNNSEAAVVNGDELIRAINSQRGSECDTAIASSSSSPLELQFFEAARGSIVGEVKFEPALQHHSFCQQHPTPVDDHSDDEKSASAAASEKPRTFEEVKNSVKIQEKFSLVSEESSELQTFEEKSPELQTHEETFEVKLEDKSPTSNNIKLQAFADDSDLSAEKSSSQLSAFAGELHSSSMENNGGSGHGWLLPSKPTSNNRHQCQRRPFPSNENQNREDHESIKFTNNNGVSRPNRVVEIEGPFRTVLTKVADMDKHQMVKNSSNGKPPLPPRQVAPCRSKIIDARLQFFNRQSENTSGDVTHASNGRTKLGPTAKDLDDHDQGQDQVSNKSLERFRQRAQEGIERAAKSVFDLQSVLRHNLEESKAASSSATVGDIDPNPTTKIVVEKNSSSELVVDVEQTSKNKVLFCKNGGSRSSDDDDQIENGVGLIKNRLEKNENSHPNKQNENRPNTRIAIVDDGRIKKDGRKKSADTLSSSSSSSSSTTSGADERTNGRNDEKKERTERSPSIGYLETDIDTLHSREVILVAKENAGRNKQHKKSSSNRNNFKARSMFNLNVNEDDERPNDQDDKKNNNGDFLITNKSVTSGISYSSQEHPTTADSQAISKENQIFCSGSPSSSCRLAKSMEFLLKEEDKATILPPENQLQQMQQQTSNDGGAGVTRHLSEHELRFRRSLQKLNLPDWYKNSPLAKPGSTEGLLLLNRERQLRRSNDGGGAGTGTTTTPARWEDLRSRSTSVTSLGGASNRSVVIHKRVTTPDWRHVKSSRESLLQSPMSPDSTAAAGSAGGDNNKSSYFQYYYNSTGISRWSSSRLSSTTAGSSRSTSPTGSAATAPPAPTSSNFHRSPFQRQPYLGWRSSERLCREKTTTMTSPALGGDNDSNINGGGGSFYRSAAERLSQGPGYYAMRFGGGGSGANYRSAHTLPTGSRHPEVTVKVYEPDDQQQRPTDGQTSSASSSSESPPEHVRVAAELSREIDKMINRGSNGVQASTTANNNNMDNGQGQDQDDDLDENVRKSQIESDVSPKSKRVWMESSFVGIRPIRGSSEDDKKEPVVTTSRPVEITSPWQRRQDDANHHHEYQQQQQQHPIKSDKKQSPINEDTCRNHLPDRRLSLTSTTLEEVLDSLLALPSSSKSPSPSGGSSYHRTSGSPGAAFARTWDLNDSITRSSKKPVAVPADGPVLAHPHNGTMTQDFPQPSAPPCPEEDEEEEQEEPEVDMEQGRPPPEAEAACYPPDQKAAARGSITSNGSSSQMTSDSSSSNSSSSSARNSGATTSTHRRTSEEVGAGGAGSSDLTTATTVGSSVSSLSAELATNASSSSSSATTSGGSSTSGSASALAGVVKEVIAPPPEFGGISPLLERIQQESVDFDELEDYEVDDDGQDGGGQDGVDDGGFPPPPTQEDIFPDGVDQPDARQEAGGEEQEAEDEKQQQEPEVAESVGLVLLRDRRVSTNQMMDESVVVRCSYVDSCTSTAELRDARRTYKTCHNCYTYYCSRECRKSHWDKHRHVCMYGRIRGMCKQAILCARDNPEFLMHLSRLARTGHLTHGPGFVKLVFRNTDLALHFLRHGGGWSQLEDGPIYVSWKDLLPQEMGVEVYRAVIDMCQSYEPDVKFVLLASIFITREVPSMESVPHWEREVIAKCARLSLAKSVVTTMGSSVAVAANCRPSPHPSSNDHRL